ncbi:bifunctional DNA primase/polymerase [Calothrix sp. FACHB-1219]|uniref:bifunctional DNA primase/polymerase n=1 Tax=unclassified Calothrix TaxID=2619626 RepID=UPI0016822CED|nr:MULTISPECIES: bifunctional DNA primase/polymerase [unclassified Calothrix]MBD2202699.1 bifunctional DNA primase/polymerase [Calothrix sp. FACHB-168]MBD2218852.1 bifunctional DNA primase/polymerase [Calothrix sp. FACHB-1219]
MTSTQNYSEYYQKAQYLISGLDHLPKDWALTPVNGSKRPYRSNWQSEKPLSREAIAHKIQDGDYEDFEDKKTGQIKQHFCKAKGYGIRTGEISGGILAIDVDGQNAEPILLELASGDLPDTVTFSSGKPGRRQMLYYVPPQYWGVVKPFKLPTGIKGEDGKEEQLEFRWNGQQSVLPPSVHPETGQYHWVRSPQEIGIANCPMWLLDLMIERHQAANTPRVAAPTPTQAQAITGSPPLEIYLGRDDRSLVESGTGNGARNDAAQKLSLNLVATARRLDELSLPYSGTPRQLYDDFCSRCTPPLGSDVRGEALGWWKNAEAIAKHPSLDDEKLLCCYEAWLKKQQPRLSQKASNQLNDQPLENTADEAQRLTLDVKRWNAEQDPARRATILRELRKQGYARNEVQEIASYLDRGTRTAQAKLLTPEEFMNFVPDGLTWLFPGLLPASGVTVLGGSPGAGKSLLAYDCAAAFLFGESFLGEEPAKTGKVLFALSDEPETFVQDKLINRGFYASKNWRILHNWDESQWLAFEMALEDFHPDLVVIDSFASIHRNQSFDENSSQAKLTIMKLDDTLRRYNAAGLLIHHSNKNKEQKGVDKLRGSTAIAAAASMVWLLTGEPQAEVKQFSTPKVRGTAPVNFNISLASETGRYKLVSGNEEMETTKPVIQRLKAYFERIGCDRRLEVEEIQDAIGGSRDSLWKALSRLCTQGVLVKAPSKSDPRRKVYYLSHNYTVAKKSTPLLPPTNDLSLSSILAETLTGQGLDILDKKLDNFSENTPQNEPQIHAQHKTQPLYWTNSQNHQEESLSSIMAEIEAQQSIEQKHWTKTLDSENELVQCVKTIQDNASNKNTGQIPQIEGGGGVVQYF